jgi:hydroxybutyrate-dimer hydrolase
MAEVRATGRLRGKPTLILHGRSDALIAPNHSSRPYYALNKLRDAPDNPTRYIEVVNANHFDFFIPIFGANTLVPMHHYLDQALDLMLRHLSDPKSHPLPDSQVIPATAGSKPWTGKNWCEDLPDIAPVAALENRITFGKGVLTIPEGKRQPASKPCRPL